jgi:hypothetical protein
LIAPQDVPPWMTRGGQATRAAAAALAADAQVVRRLRDTLNTVLLDTAKALGWQGTAAQAAQVRAKVMHGVLAAIIVELDDARIALLGLATALDATRCPGPPRGLRERWCRCLCRCVRWPAVEARAADARAAGAAPPGC